jgi:triacylglycerol esterase/lipase EstA (alpha/beta hydrolase family)
MSACRLIIRRNSSNIPSKPPSQILNNREHLEICLAQSFRATKYPVVLCHGIKTGIITRTVWFIYVLRVGFDSLFEGTRFQLRYWNNIEAALRKLGCEVYTSSVGTASSLKKRSEQLHYFLESHLPERNINIIGHSMVSHLIMEGWIGLSISMYAHSFKIIQHSICDYYRHTSSWKFLHGLV